MKKCEYCDKIIDGRFGSGRFCNKKCACGYSTKEKRQKINKIVSDKLKGIITNPKWSFKKGFDSRRRKFGPDDWAKAVESNHKRLNELYQTLDWDELPLSEKRRCILAEQNERCFKCGLNEWMGEPLVLELHHVDGNNTNDVRCNLQMLCPNCHSQTPNWRNKKRNVQKEKL